MIQTARQPRLAYVGSSILALLLCLPVSRAQDCSLDNVLGRLQSSDPAGKRAAAATLLETWGQDNRINKVLPILLQALKDEDASVRRDVANTFYKAALSSWDNARDLNHAVPELAKSLSDQDPQVRQSIAQAIALVNPRPPKEVEANMLALLHDPVPAVRRAGLTALAKIRPVSPHTVTAVVKSLEEDPATRGTAAHTLGELGVTSETGITALGRSLDDPEPFVRQEAVGALARIGPGARAAIPALRRMTNNPEELEHIQQNARQALSRITGERFEPDRPEARGDHRQRGTSTPELLSHLESTGDLSVIPTLKEAFTASEREEEKQRIASVLLSVGEADESYVSYLIGEARPAIESDIPFPFRLDEDGNPIKGDFSPEFLAWCSTNGETLNAATETALFVLPGPVRFLAGAGDPRAFNLLLEGLKSRNYLIAALSAKGLAKLQDRRAIQPIIQVSRQVPPEAARRIASSLVYFDDPEAQAAAEEFIKDKAYLEHLRKQAKEQGVKALFGY